MIKEVIKKNQCWAVVTHAFIIPVLGGRGRHTSLLDASLVYRARSRTARGAQKNPGSKNRNRNHTPTQKS